MSGPVVQARFDRGVTLESLLPVLEEVASAVAGRALAWAPRARSTRRDQSSGADDLFETRCAAEGVSLTVALHNDAYGNPRDGWGYELAITLEVAEAEGTVRIQHAQGSSGVELQRLSLEVEAAPTPARRRSTFESVRATLLPSLGRHGLAARDETGSPMRAWANVTVVSHTDRDFAIALADEALAALPTKEPDDREWRGRLLEARAQLGPVPELLGERLESAPASLDAWRSALGSPPDGVTKKQITRAIARLAPYDREAVEATELAKVAGVWLEHPLWVSSGGSGGWTELSEAQASTEPVRSVPADSGWLHAEDAAGVLNRHRASPAIVRALLPGLVGPDPDGAPLGGGASQRCMRHARREGPSLLASVELEQVRGPEHRRWTFLFGAGPTDVLVVLQVLVTTPGAYGNVEVGPPWMVRALGSKAWVAKAVRAASGASTWGLMAGAALPDLREPARFDGTPTELVVELLESVGRPNDARLVRAAVEAGGFGTLRDLYTSADRPGAFPADRDGRLAGAITLGAIRLAMDVVRQDEVTIESAFTHLCRQRATLARARGK